MRHSESVSVPCLVVLLYVIASVNLSEFLYLVQVVCATHSVGMETARDCVCAGARARMVVCVCDWGS